MMQVLNNDKVHNYLSNLTSEFNFLNNINVYIHNMPVRIILGVYLDIIFQEN